MSNQMVRRKRTDETRDLTLHKDRLYHRSPKSTFEKAYMHGWLHERSKKSFGWTDSRSIFCVLSCGRNIDVLEIEQSWASGDAPWKVISITIFACSKQANGILQSSSSRATAAAMFSGSWRIEKSAYCNQNEDRFGLRLITKSDKTTLSRSLRRVRAIVRIGFTQFVRLFERHINEQRQKKCSVIPRSSIRPIEMSRFKLRTYTTIRIIPQRATQHLPCLNVLRRIGLWSLIIVIESEIKRCTLDVSRP